MSPTNGSVRGNPSGSFDPHPKPSNVPDGWMQLPDGSIVASPSRILPNKTITDPGQMLPPGDYYSTIGHPLRNSLARQAGIPDHIDLSKPDNVVGLSYENLMQYYQLRNFDTVPQPPKAGTSGKAKVFKTPDHPDIEEVQYHPGGGIHGKSPYYKFTMRDKTKIKEIKVIQDLSEFDPRTPGAKQVHYNKYGQRIEFNRSTRSWEIINDD